jgi:CheY-like chemotaxis protein
LLADDSVTAQNMGRRILSDAGYEVVTVNNGSAALKKIAEQKPDLIVLDVYMPGYGGLEVCQRVKENRETARTPVLLTVGKLEPFKPEEARRVRADAFIVKPFEASELLTALTRLEDKIVPQGPQKPGRFAKALAAMEQSASENGESFGDAETGWKNRLTIPPPSAKAGESEAETSRLPGAVVRELWRDQESKPLQPKQEFERPIPAGLPPDITPEEIAAITAAAASFDGKAQEPTQSEAAAKTQAGGSEPAIISAVMDERPAETPAATFASAQPTDAAGPEVKPEAAEVAPATEGSVASEVAQAGETPTAENPVATDTRVMPSATDSEEKMPTEAATPERAAKPWTSDAEVMAAIASLAPSNGHADERAQSDGFVTTDVRQGEEIPVTVAAAVASAAMTAGEFASGPRWIAEAIPVPEDESTFILQQEMEKAYAAFAAADAGRASYAAAVAVKNTVSAGENVESKPAQSEVAVASISETAPAAEIIPTVQDEGSGVISGGREEVAYAAAASSSSVSESASAAELTSHANALPPETAVPATEERDKQREAELAAAWQNWKQIRESIVGSQLTAQIADAAVTELKDVQTEAPVPVETDNAEVAAESEDDDEASTAGGESTAIANIVDSVLAELKPKLMEEIAKKMNTGKKEKEKEKKKKK